MLNKKIIIVAIGTLTALLMGLALAAPHLIDTEAIRGAIAREASKRVGGEVDIRGITVSFLPQPHATLHAVSL